MTDKVVNKRCGFKTFDEIRAFCRSYPNESIEGFYNFVKKHENWNKEMTLLCIENGVGTIHTKKGSLVDQQASSVFLE